ncbi:MAG: MFS transporter [Chloroflexi bacterium]|nr:MFS transporter [Chloroflexota bacterium]
MTNIPAAVSKINLSRATAIKFVILLGIVSLFADMTYEGARSISGPFLAVLGASGFIVGIVAGFGELIGYGLRLVSGYFSDRTGKYWTITLVGYAVNLIAVPLLALAGSWEIAALLMILERTGKAIRTPARDAMLSYATHQTGRGWGFGLHEAMDQIGAILGPLIVAAVLARRGTYQNAFAILLIPALLALTVLIVARVLYPNPRELEIDTPALKTEGFPRVYWIYLIGVALVAAGYVDFPLIAFHFQQAAVLPDAWIPILYAVAMGMDAIAALVFGRLFDRIGVATLVIVSLLSALFAPFVFLGGFGLALVGMALWGIGLGAQESILRAAVAGMVSPERRGSAYGIFNTGFGVVWFLGSALMGYLYDVSLPALIAFSVLTQLAAIPFFWSARREIR